MPSRIESEPSGAAHAASLPLTTLLSQALVAFIIEFDNEFERQAPHRTTIGPRTGATGPWLASMAGWSFMRLVGDEGITVRELERQARAATLPLLGMQRWGYVSIAPDPRDKRPKPPKRDWLIRPTPKGSKAREIWRPLIGTIEDRWQQRFGTEAIANLRNALVGIVNRFDFELPDFLPILGYGLFAAATVEPKAPANGGTADAATARSLPTLLAKALLAITLDFERQWPISLATFLNTLRLLNDTGVPRRDLPRLAGVSQEAIGFTISFLRSQKYIEIALDPRTPRTKLVRLSEKGAASKVACRRRLIQVEEDFRNSYGHEQVERLRSSLMAILDARDASRSLLGQGLIPHPDGWRAGKAYIAQTLAAIQDPAGNLPRYPMVLHRGGFPDGS